MKLIIVTGMSGAGKSKAVDDLEDAGYYCLDNLPVKLLPSVLDWMEHNRDFPKKVAVTLDIRSKDISDSFFATLETVRKAGIPARVLYLECEDAVLVKRYKESRRLHPLMTQENSTDISTALAEERLLLAEVRQTADFIVDTSRLSTAELKKKLSELLEKDSETDGMLLRFLSFGYKYGIPAEADLVFDVRCLPNPYYVESLRQKNGTDKEVSDFIFNNRQGQEIFERIRSYLSYTVPLYEKEGRAQLVVAFGCTGGQHRSTAFACRIRDFFASEGRPTVTVFRDMDVNMKDIKSRE